MRVGIPRRDGEIGGLRRGKCCWRSELNLESANFGVQVGEETEGFWAAPKPGATRPRPIYQSMAPFDVLINLPLGLVHVVQYEVPDCTGSTKRAEAAVEVWH